MTHRKTAHHWVPAAFLTGALLLTAGCSSDDPGPLATPGSTTPDSPSDSPAASESPTVAPATGPLLRRPSASMHAPAGWTREKQSFTVSVEASDPDSASQVHGDMEPVARPGLHRPAGQGGRPELDRPPAIVDPVEIDGVSSTTWPAAPRSSTTSRSSARSTTTCRSR